MIGAVHAGESGAELIIPVFERLLVEEKRLLDTVSICAIPTLNVDERERLAQGVPWYLRTNANGVDLNRNFPSFWDVREFHYGFDTADPDSLTYRGLSPASEPETQTAIRWLEEQKPAALFACHCLAGICGMHLLGSRYGENDADYVRTCQIMAQAYLSGMSNDDQQDSIEYACSAGSLATWACQTMKIPAFDIEVSQKETEALKKCRVDKTDLPLLEEYRNRHFHGLRQLLQFIAQGE